MSIRVPPPDPVALCDKGLKYDAKLNAKMLQEVPIMLGDLQSAMLGSVVAEFAGFRLAECGLLCGACSNQISLDMINQETESSYNIGQVYV